MRRGPLLYLLPATAVVMLTAALATTASARPDELGRGPRDLKAQPGVVHNHNHDQPEYVDPATIPTDAAVQAVCSGGMASGYPCNNVDLMSNLPLASMGGGSGSAGWGWVDPSNGR